MSSSPPQIAPALASPTGAPEESLKEERRDVLWAGLLAIVLCVAYQLVYGNYNLNMRDEGYLWYGVQQVLRGEVPLRDFQAYDPGRYYWCAWLSPIFGTGIIGLRASVVSFSAFGLMAGLLVVRRFAPSRAWLLPAALMLVLTLFPRHKLFEPAIVMLAIWTTTRMIERPSLRRTFLAGVIVGLAAVFGRNHGIYLVIAYVVLFGICLKKRLDPHPWRSAASLTVGVLLGYAPVLGMLLWVPGYREALWDAILSVKTVGSNIVEPYLWPWSPAPINEMENVNTHWIAPFGLVALHIAYLLPVFFFPVALLKVLRFEASDFRRHAGLAAAVLIGIPYAYHYAVRSDVPHLFQAIHPVLLGILGLAAVGSRRRLQLPLSLGLLLLGALLVALTEHPELKHSIDTGHAQERVDLEMHGDVLRVPERLGQDIELVRNAINLMIPEDEEIFILPTMPTYYPILGKRSPSWWIYLLWHNSKAEQLRIIEELKAANITKIITIARPFNRDPAFNLDQTNPALWKYILRNFKQVRTPPHLPMPLRIHLWVHNSEV